jgi:YVTN family beta-propeller protein
MYNSFAAKIFIGVLMSFQRVGLLAAIVVLIVLWSACGQVYRPVVLPCSLGGLPNCPIETPPAPTAFHAVFGVSLNVPNYPGNAMQIDVGGDSIIGETPSSDASAPNIGDNPTHAATLPNDSAVFVASAASLVPGGIDEVSTFTPATTSLAGGGLGPVQNIVLPTGSLPVFLNTTENGNMYVANFGTNSVGKINISASAEILTGPVGVNPVSMAEIPDAQKIYVANQGDNSISDVNPLDLTSTLVPGFTGTAPVWVVARDDSQKVYALSQGDGQLVTIDVATDAVTSSLPVGAGANYLFYDSNLNRLYVTNPVTSTVYVFSISGGANDTPALLTSIAFTAGSAACPSGCSPSSITALADGSRFYVASYQMAATCPDPLAGTSGACVIPSVAVFNAPNFTLKTTLTLLTDPPFSANLSTNKFQYAVPATSTCAPAVFPATYSPTTVRFRVFTAASVDSSRVYVSMCDAGAIAVINTLDNNANNPTNNATPADTLINDLPTAFSVCTASNCNGITSITAFSITSNVVTFHAANSFKGGEKIFVSGLTTDTYLNSNIFTVLSTGLSGSQFECFFTHANVPLTSVSGTATVEPPSQSPIFLVPGQ